MNLLVEQSKIQEHHWIPYGNSEEKQRNASLPKGFDVLVNYPI
jgi:hypothetical protein